MFFYINKKASPSFFLLCTHNFWSLLLPLIFLTIPLSSQVIDGGYYHSFVVCSDSTVWAFGRNNFGQLGDGTNNNSTQPVVVSGLTGVVAVAAGGDHSLALKSNGTVWAWGFNNHGQLGNSGFANSNVPVQVQGLSNIYYISAGESYSFALKNDGSVWAWGKNNSGQLGDGTFDDRNIPLLVTGIGSVISISAGQSHTLALKNDGTVWGWGANQFGQLGENNAIISLQPVQITAATGVKSVAAGIYHSVAVKNDGTVWSWGYNGHGVLGDGSTVSNAAPVQASGMADVTTIESGQSFIIALKNGGLLRAWGNNHYGQIGNGTGGSKLSPVDVTLAGVVQQAGGIYHSLAVKNDGTVWSWGLNNYGQLGDSSAIDRNAPVQVKLGCSVTVMQEVCGFTTSTKVRQQDCGTTLAMLNKVIYCSSIDGAENYEWEWSFPQTGFTKTVVRGTASANFIPSWVNGIEYGKTYNVSVRAKLNGEWLSYCEACQVSTPQTIPATKVSLTNCGNTLVSLSQLIYCDIVPGATNYEWEWSHPATGFVKTVIRGSASSNFTPTWVAGLEYGKTYIVRVRAKSGITWGSYGSSCQVSTPAIMPATKVRAPDCGIVLYSFNQWIYCDPVAGASNYQWEWKTGNEIVKGIVRGNSSPNFNPLWATGFAYGTTYNVRVRAKVGTQWGSYGSVCTVITPSQVGNKILAPGNSADSPQSALAENHTYKSGKEIATENATIDETVLGVYQSIINHQPSTITVFPNPSGKNGVYIFFENISNTDGYLRISLLNMLGQQILQDIIPFTSANNPVYLAFTNPIPSGTYLFRFSSDESQYHQKLIVE